MNTQPDIAMKTREALSPAAARRTARAGFTLIEIVAAIGILAIMVLLIGQLFTDATAAMRTGTRVAEVNANARAVLDFMARDIQTAMFDDPSTADEPPYLLLRTVPTRPSVRPPHYLGQTAAGPRELVFVAPVNVPNRDRPRETKIVLYRIRNQRIGDRFIDHRYELMRSEYYDDPMARYNVAGWADNPTAGTYDTAWRRADVMIQNVRAARFMYLRSHTGIDIPSGGDARTDEDRIAYLDVQLELLSPQDAIRAAELFGIGGGGAPARQFVERNVRRYHQRIFFYNAHGYYRPNR